MLLYVDTASQLDLVSSLEDTDEMDLVGEVESTGDDENSGKSSSVTGGISSKENEVSAAEQISYVSRYTRSRKQRSFCTTSEVH
jgi:hypothetical protein